MKEIKIAVAGTGYVGLSMATLLSQHHPVGRPESDARLEEVAQTFADHYDSVLDDVQEKVYTRDIFRRD